MKTTDPEVRGDLVALPSSGRRKSTNEWLNVSVLLCLFVFFLLDSGDFKFDKIGSAYNASVPVYAMRSVPAAMGSALIPLVYLIVLQLGFSQWTAGLAAFLFLFGAALPFVIRST